jgi:hypothetical protein
MGNRYVSINITRQTQPTSQAGFGMPLILSTEKALAYKEYSALSEVAVDFTSDKKAYKIAAAVFGQNPSVDKLAIYGISTYILNDPVTELSDALNTLILTKNDWFFLLADTQTDAEITQLATWAAANDKMYFASTANKTLGTTLNNDNTALMVHTAPTTYPASAWVGMGASREVGSFTWTFKSLNNIDPVTTYNDADVSAIHAANASTYIKEGGVNITSHGVVTSGEYIDVIQSQYYLKSRMAENIFNLLVNTDKVPFTTKGIALVAAEVEKTLRDAYEQGIIAEDANGKPIYSVDIPKIGEISDADKANRRLPNVNWTCTIAGAVEDVDVNGTMEI